MGYVDFDAGALRLPDSKTGAKTVQLGLHALELLKTARRVEGNPWVITGTIPSAPLYDLQSFWQRVRARAGLKDVRIHDLRHNSESRIIPSAAVVSDKILGLSSGSLA